MSNFHLNTDTGAVLRCHAKDGNCPWKIDDGFERHFESIKDARNSWEEAMSHRVFSVHTIKNGIGQQMIEGFEELGEPELTIEDKINIQEAEFNKLDRQLRGIVRRSPNFMKSDAHYQKTLKLRETFYKMLALKKDRYDGLDDEQKVFEDGLAKLKTEAEEAKKAKWFADQAEKNGAYNFHPDIDSKNGPEARQVLTAMTGLSVEKINILASEKMKEGKTVTQAFREIFDETPLRTDKPIIAVDIETACPLINGWVDRGPLSSIIQVGYIVRHPDGRVEKEEYLAGVPDDLLKGAGTGAEHIHNISPEMVAGLKPLVDQPDRQKKILDVFKNSVMLAHNANFEDGQFRHSVPGFGRAMLDGKIEVLDTQHVCRYYCPETPANTNEAFVEGTGGKYLEAHNAMQDAKMSLNGLLRKKGYPEVE